MALFHHFSELKDEDRIVNDVYPILLKLLGHQVDAVLEWNYQDDRMFFTYQWPYHIPGHQSGETIPLTKFISLVHPDDYPDLENSFNRFVEGDEKVFFYKCRFVFPDKQVIYAELMSAALTDADGRPEKFITLIKDYTSLQHTNNEVKELTLAIENAMSGIAWLDKEGHFQMVRPDYARMLGYAPEELVGKSYKVTVSQTDADLAHAAYLKMLKLGKYDLDIQAVRKDGSVFHKNILMIKTFDQAGKHNGHYCLMKDISGQVNYEKAIRRQNDELRKVNQELDNLVYRVSHDLRAPIASSLGLANLITNSKDIEEIRNYTNLQYKSLSKLDGLIRDILNYSVNSRKEVDKKSITWQTFIENILQQELQHVPDMVVGVHIEQTGYFYSDPVRIGIVLKNLLANAAHFRDFNKEEHTLNIHIVCADETTTLTVTDNGLGIDPAIHHRIFEMFFRGHEQSKGAGLGLYIAKEIVAKLGGSISLSSLPQMGSTFTVILPGVV